MRFVISVEIRVHRSAQARFTDWIMNHKTAFQQIRNELRVSLGIPIGTKQLQNRKWVWSHADTFISYVIRDKPLTAMSGRVSLPVFVQREVTITDIFAV